MYDKHRERGRDHSSDIIQEMNEKTVRASPLPPSLPPSLPRFIPPFHHLPPSLPPFLPPSLQTSRRTVEMLFVRGDVVILVSPPLRTG